MKYFYSEKIQNTVEDWYDRDSMRADIIRCCISQWDAYANIDIDSCYAFVLSKFVGYLTREYTVEKIMEFWEVTADEFVEKYDPLIGDIGKLLEDESKLIELIDSMAKLSKTSFEV
jgi:pyridoxal/pyridoxine/pyridoxamine kinase